MEEECKTDPLVILVEPEANNLKKVANLSQFKTETMDVTSDLDHLPFVTLARGQTEQIPSYRPQELLAH